MSTSYYVRLAACGCCGRVDEYEIAHTAAGWALGGRNKGRHREF